MKLLVQLTLILFLSLSVFADPINSNRIPLKAKWYVHFDMDVFLKSNIGKDLTIKALKDPNISKVNATLQLIGVDIQKLKNLTVYGMEFDKNKWLVAIDGNINAATVLEQIKTNLPCEMTVLNGIDVYNNVTEEEKFYFFIKDNTLYFSKESGLIFAHILMINGKEKSLKDIGKLSGIPMSGLMVFGSANSLTDEGNDETMKTIAKVVTKVNGGVKETAGVAKGDVCFETGNAGNAETLNQLLTGMIGMLKINFAKTPNLLAAIKGIVISKEGSFVKIKGSLDSDSLFALMNQEEHK